MIISLIIHFCELAQYSIESAILRKRIFCCESCTLVESAPVLILSAPSPKKNHQVINALSLSFSVVNVLFFQRQGYVEIMQ